MSSMSGVFGGLVGRLRAKVGLAVCLTVVVVGLVALSVQAAFGVSGFDVWCSTARGVLFGVL